MMQIILTVVGMLLAAGTGYAVLTSIQVQNAASYQDDTISRLNLASKAVERSLERIPGTQSLAAPMATSQTGVGYSVIPASIGPVRGTSSGVPFAYCPVARLSPAEQSALPSSSAGSVSMSSGSYDVEIYGGRVVSSDLAINADVQQWRRPIAFIVAPLSKGGEPPACSEISWRSNDAFVEGGLVRVISEPETTGTYSGVDARAMVFYAASGASGSGRSASDPANIQSIVRDAVAGSPDTLTIYVTGVVSLDQTDVALFNQALGSSNTRLSIIGFGNDPEIDLTKSVSWDLPRSTVLKNMIVRSGGLVVGSNEQLTLDGSILLDGGNITGSNVLVLAGGYLRADGSRIFFENESRMGFEVRGRASFVGAQVKGVQVPAFYVFLNGGSVDFEGSRIGAVDGVSTRPRDAALIAANGAKVSGSNAIAYATTGGTCFMTMNGDQSFAWNDQTRSRIVGENNYLRPADGSSAAEFEAYYLGRDQRVQARRQNGSDIICS